MATKRLIQYPWQSQIQARPEIRSQTLGLKKNIIRSLIERQEPKYITQGKTEEVHYKRQRMSEAEVSCVEADQLEKGLLVF